MSYHSSWLVKHFHFLLCDPIKVAGCSLPVNTLEQSWHSYAMSSSIFSIFTPYLILGLFTNWILIRSWSLPSSLLGNTEQDFHVSIGRAAFSSACSPVLLAKPSWGSVGLLGERLLVFVGDGVCWSPPWQVEVTLLMGGLWNLAPHAKVKCPLEQRHKWTTSSSSGEVWMWILASLFTSLIQQCFPTCCDCNIKMVSERLLLHFTSRSASSSTSHSSDPQTNI